jgi:hypothetical protein
VRGRSPALSVDALLDPGLREEIEERYWRPIEAGATLEALRRDPAFLADPRSHPALFADHGVVHVRDIAIGLVELGSVLDGVVLPRRPEDRQRFMVAYGVLAAYFHDIGMRDQTAAGRRVHAIYAAHAVFSAGADDLVQRLVAGGGPVVRRLEQVDREDPFGAPVDVVLRELLSLAMAHSKSTVPTRTLDDRSALRRLMQRSLFTDLGEHRASPRTPDPADETPVAYHVNHERYGEPSSSFGWLDATTGPQAALADDVLDAVRLLRAADALRQRGTGLRTSAGFEICIDTATGRVVYTLRSEHTESAYLLSYHDRKGAGEANIRMATVTAAGNLRIAVHRGGFLTESARHHAAHGTAHVISDIVTDVLPPFAEAEWRSDLPQPSVPGLRMRVELERPGDRPDFADEVVGLVLDEHPELSGRIVAVSDVESADSGERDRYHRGAPLSASEASDLLSNMAAHGAKVSGLDVEGAMDEVRIVTVHEGETLVALGSWPSFVYVSTAPGLTVRPGAGYEPQALRPWVPVGTTGVVRRAERNSDIVADATVAVVMIPAERYANEWFDPYTPDELMDVLRQREFV